MLDTLPLTNSTVVALATIAALVAALALRHVRQIPHRKIQRLRVRYLPMVGAIPGTEGLLGVLANKTGDREEHVYRVDATVQEVEEALRRADFAPNPISSLKYRETEAGRQYSVLSWRYTPTPTSKRQFHVFGFEYPGDEWTLDLFAHEERSWSADPIKHRTDTNQDGGDPDGRIREALEKAGIDVTAV